MALAINCDMGEGFGLYRIGDDAGIMPYITMANVACGFHASDPSVMHKTVRLAKQHGVKVGAHPSLPDLQGFGRREIQIFRFPSSFCSDDGRRINNFDADWPDSLTGVAREIYEAYEKHLRPIGYKMRAQILDYPDGKPGDVGLFLRW